MSEYVNQHELRVIGMSRSGNHAILNWIYRQAEGKTCFLNCVEPKTNPFESARPMDDGRHAWTSSATVDLNRQAEGGFTPLDWLIYSYEDCFLGMVAHPEFERRREAYVGRSRERIEILVLRDPLNLFASRLRADCSQLGVYAAKRIWKQHAREFLGLRQYLPTTPVTISFNRWVTDIGYRASLAERLGLGFTDAGFEEVTATAGGSSFDGCEFNGRASQMEVLRRWLHCCDDESYLEILDTEMLELSTQIFGALPGSELLIRRVAERSPEPTGDRSPACSGK